MTIGEERDLRPDCDETAPTHGYLVFATAQRFAPKATFSFYRVLDSDETATAGDSIPAFKAAKQDGVDILNTSLGLWEWTGYYPKTPVATAITQTDAVVVAAAGNGGDVECVNFPARLPEAIGVGGYLPGCVKKLGDYGQEDGRYWADTHTVNCVKKEYQGNYCGYTGNCGPRANCQEYRVERAWKRNPRQWKQRTDVLAPVLHPLWNENGCYFTEGSSFAAPTVSGLIAAVLGRVEDWTPEAVQTAVCEEAVPLNEDSGVKLDANAVFDRLSN